MKASLQEVPTPRPAIMPTDLDHMLQWCHAKHPPISMYACQQEVMDPSTQQKRYDLMMAVWKKLIWCFTAGCVYR